MLVLDQVVLGLLAARVAGQAALLAQPVEPRGAAGEDLVHVGLVPGVEEDRLARRVEDPVQRDAQLHDAQVGPEVASGARDPGDQEVADLGRQLVELVVVEGAQVRRTGQLLEMTQCPAFRVWPVVVSHDHLMRR